MVINKKSQLGFTLLELLLVIVILGLLATIGLAMMQRNAVSTKVDKAAQQMQILLQAATAYYIDNGCWPNNSISSTQSTICPPTTAQPQYQVSCNNGTPPSFDAYIPKGLNKDPWGHTYTCEPEPNKGKKFSVFIDSLPSAAVRQQLLNKLPNAKSAPLKPGSQAVTTEITTPLNIGNSNVLVQAMGTTGDLSDGQLFAKNLNTNNPNAPLQFTCPPGWQGGLSTMLNSIDSMPEYRASEDLEWLSAPCVNAFITTSFYQLDPNVTCTSTTDINTRTTTYACNGNIAFWTKGVKDWCEYVDDTSHYSVGTVNFFYIAWCTPPTPEQSKANNAPIIKLF